YPFKSFGGCNRLSLGRLFTEGTVDEPLRKGSTALEGSTNRRQVERPSVALSGFRNSMTMDRKKQREGW
ncbi:MAG: hypothetical protein ACK5OC_29495, partial [Pirellula sp.]